MTEIVSEVDFSKHQSFENMYIIKYVSCVLLIVIVSFGFFPFVPSFFPIANTKMVMAGIGLILLFLNMPRGRTSEVDRSFFNISLFAIAVSFAGILATGYNNTMDYAYSTYIVSMWVWCGSAYLITRLIKKLHQGISIRLITNYLIIVCVLQCLLALLMDFYPNIKNMVDSLLVEEGFMGKVEERMYGLGCSLDVAGTRFSAVLVLIASFCCNDEKVKKSYLLPLYVMAFVTIVVIGNMISRTTIIGTILAVLYIIGKTGLFRLTVYEDDRRLWRIILPVALTSFILCSYLYMHNQSFHDNIRFAFEGFFSLHEKGFWETNSNNRLADMVIFPTEIKTWVIGDGYFENPLSTNPYYIGPGEGTFYMNTDIGYLRLIYYFGIVGLLAFCSFFVYVAMVCTNRFERHKKIFLILLFLNLIIWFKVSTDIFVVFSFFLCISPEDQQQADLIEQQEFQKEQKE